MIVCLHGFHWSVPSQYTVTLALILAVVLTVRVSWAMVKERFGAAEPGISRVESVCNDMRRARAPNERHQAAVQLPDELDDPY